MYFEFDTIFQFHYGSIIRYFFNIKKEISNSFQFHYGSIIGRLKNVSRSLIKKFQFHYGSIIRGKITQKKQQFY